MWKNTSFKNSFGFDDKMVLIVGIPISAMIVSIMLFNDRYANCDWQFLSVCIPISFVYTTVYWVVLRGLYLWVKKQLPRLEDLLARMGLMSVLLLFSFWAVNKVLDGLFRYFFPNHFSNPNILMEFLATMLLSALIFALYEGISFYVQLQKTIAEKVDLERQHVQSQLEGLRNQVNPHFLFNSLNTLAYLIPENSENAVRFVQKMSKVYRYVLESRDEPVICLHEELDYLKAYLFLLKERFGDNLQVHVSDLAPWSHYKIVPLTFQMLLENAIKHNVISTEKPLWIEVFHENNHLVVRNNLQPKNQVMHSTGVGLENIRERYRLLMALDIQVITSQQYFTVLIPIK